MPKKRRGGYVMLKTPEGVQRWRICFKRLKKRFAEVDWNTKTVYVDPAQTDWDLSHTLIHEAEHIATGLGSEDKIEGIFNDVATDAREMLNKVGLLKLEED